MTDTMLVSITSQGKVTIPTKTENKALTFSKPEGVFQKLGIHKKSAFKGKKFEEILAIEKAALADAVVERYLKKQKRSNGKLYII